MSARRLIAESAEATRAIGARLGEAARPRDVIALSGELGAGKTCFVQGLAVGLGVDEPVTSPTFILVAEHGGRLPLHHVDLYRIDGLEEMRALGLEELFEGEGVTVVEWGEKAAPLLPSRTVHIRIHGVGDEPREIEIAGLSPERAARLRLDSSSRV